MNKINFNVVIPNENLYQGLTDTGLLISDINLVNNCKLFIIGTEISYDTIDFHKYNKFELLFIPENLIIEKYKAFISKTIKDKRIGTMMLSLLSFNEYRKISLKEIFKISTFKDSDRDKVDSLINKEYIPKVY
jgi:hypothetical protein